MKINKYFYLIIKTNVIQLSNFLIFFFYFCCCFLINPKYNAKQTMVSEKLKLERTKHKIQVILRLENTKKTGSWNTKK